MQCRATGQWTGLAAAGGLVDWRALARVEVRAVQGGGSRRVRAVSLVDRVRDSVADPCKRHRLGDVYPHPPLLCVGGGHLTLGWVGLGACNWPAGAAPISPDFDSRPKLERASPP